MNAKEIKAWRRLGLALAVALIGVTLSLPAQSAEVTSGMTVRDSGFTGGEHWEFTWYTPDRDWRAGLTWTNTQSFGTENYLDCGYLCVWKTRPITVDSYATAYIQRMIRWRSIYAGVGIDVHEKREPLLGAIGSFRLSAGWRVDKHWSLEYTHMSNAGLARPNWGQDLILIRYEW